MTPTKHRTPLATTSVSVPPSDVPSEPVKRGRGRPKGSTSRAIAQAARVKRMAISREQMQRGLAPPVMLGSKPRYDLAEAQVLLGISLHTVRKRIADGDLQAVRDGDRVFITDEEMRRYARTPRIEKRHSEEDEA